MQGIIRKDVGLFKMMICDPNLIEASMDWSRVVSELHKQNKKIARKAVVKALFCLWCKGKALVANY